jgi:hypothetical protein
MDCRIYRKRKQRLNGFETIANTLRDCGRSVANRAAERVTPRRPIGAKQNFLAFFGSDKPHRCSYATKHRRQAVARIRASMKALMHSVDADFGKGAFLQLETNLGKA